jgi:hypothetical protein
MGSVRPVRHSPGNDRRFAHSGHFLEGGRAAPRGYFGDGQSLSVGKTNGMTILGSPTGFASGSTGSGVLSPLPGVAAREAGA